MYAKSLQSRLTLCDPVDCSPPGFSVHGILQARNWSGLPCPPPGDFLDPGIKPTSFMSPGWQAGSLPLVPPGQPGCLLGRDFWSVYFLCVKEFD